MHKQTNTQTNKHAHAALRTSGDLAAIAAAADTHYLSLADMESDICVPELRHFVYKSETTSQVQCRVYCLAVFGSICALLVVPL